MSTTKQPFGGNLNLSDINLPNTTDLITLTGELEMSTSSKEAPVNVKHLFTTKQPTTLPETNPLKTNSFEWNVWLKFGSLENLPATKQSFTLSTNLPETNSSEWNRYANSVNPPLWLDFTRNLEDSFATKQPFGISTNATEIIPPTGSSIHASVTDVPSLLGKGCFVCLITFFHFGQKIDLHFR